MGPRLTVAVDVHWASPQLLLGAQPRSPDALGVAVGAPVLTALPMGWSRALRPRQLVTEAHDRLDAAEAADARAVVLTHAGPAFCAGADLKERRTGPPDSGPFVDVLRRLMDTPRPTIAAIDGAVRAGGIGLMAASKTDPRGRGLRWYGTRRELELICSEC